MPAGRRNVENPSQNIFTIVLVLSTAVALSADGSADELSAVSSAAAFAKADAVATLDQRELKCLATAVYFEARGESERGQRAIAEVILTRTQTRGRPRTICGVVYEGARRRGGCQFSFACDGRSDVPRHRASWARAQAIAADAIEARAESRSIVPGATSFHAAYVRPAWSKRMVRVARIGTHIFYRPRRARL
jgi:spore germination cell wall hydrolase CwlJ-like protein